MCLWLSNTGKTAKIREPYWAIWKERNRRAFVNVELTDQAPRNYFLCSLWIWARRFLDGASMSILEFLDWLGNLLWERSAFCYPLLPIVISIPLYILCVL